MYVCMYVFTQAMDSRHHIFTHVYACMHVCMYVFTQAMDSRHHGQRRRSNINPKMHDSEYQQEPALLCIPDLNPVQFLN